MRPTREMWVITNFEAIDKWFAVTLVSLNYLQYQQAQCYLETNQLLPLADLIRQHRWLHLESTIRQIAQEALLTGNVEQALQRHMPKAAWAVV